jgi:hypothetical protein
MPFGMTLVLVAATVVVVLSACSGSQPAADQAAPQPDDGGASGATEQAAPQPDDGGASGAIEQTAPRPDDGDTSQATAQTEPRPDDGDASGATEQTVPQPDDGGDAAAYLSAADDGSRESDRIEQEGRSFKIVRVLPRDAIPAIFDPVFISADEAGGSISDEDLVIGVSIDGDHRAYSVPYLSRHEIVNDVVGGRPIAVTW